MTDGGADSVTGWDRVQEGLFMQLFPTDYRVFRLNVSRVIGLINNHAA